MTNNDNIVGEKPSIYAKKEVLDVTKKQNLTRICEMMPKQLWVQGGKGTGKSHFLMQYALWLLEEENNILNIQNIEPFLLKNKIQNFNKLQKIEIFTYYPQYIQNIFLEKYLRPMLQNAFQSYQDFILPKKIATNQHFLIEFQDFLSKNIEVDSEVVEIFLNENDLNSSNNLNNSKNNENKNTKKSKKNTQNSNNEIEKILLLGIENDQLLYELYPQTPQTLGMVHYANMQVLEGLYYDLFYEKSVKNPKNKEHKTTKNSTKNTEKNIENVYFNKILEVFHRQKTQTSQINLSNKMPNFVLILDNVGEALKEIFWQNIIWAFSAKKRLDNEQEVFFVMPTGEKLPIPPNFYVLCASSFLDKNYIQKAFLGDYAILELDFGCENIGNITLRDFAKNVNNFIQKHKGTEYCLGEYFFKSFLENFKQKNISKDGLNNNFDNNSHNFENELLNNLFDFYIFPYLKTLFFDISLEKLLQKLQEAGIKKL